jgi:vacuolar protein sorting-associated protein 13A/C
MAKSLLLTVLVEVLGKYVEGLKEENLKVGVWSGKIQMFNLKLKENALDDLNLPVKIVRGSLKSLVVKVPWTQLASKPVEIYLEGIYALVCPLDLHKVSAEDAKRLSRDSIQSQLKKIDVALLSSLKIPEAALDTAKKASYVQQLVSHVIDNLEVNIKNIHLRYEDSFSDPKGSTFALGVTLDEIGLATTDEGWNIKYIKREKTESLFFGNGVIHKLGTLANCGIYWNPVSIRSIDSTYEQWEDFMYKTIYRSVESPDASLMKDFVYLLDPRNKLTVKIIHTGKSTETIPNVDVIVETMPISFKFDRLHYQQILSISNSFEELEKRKFWSTYRPILRPTADPRGWWFYAYRLITGRDISFSNKVRVILVPFVFGELTAFFLFPVFSSLSLLLIR